MTPHTFGVIDGLLRQWRLHPYRFLTLCILSIAVGTSGYLLRGELLPGASDTADLVADEANTNTDDVRSCSSIGTIFAGKTDLQEVINLFQSRTSSIVAEREKYLATPSAWLCVSGPGGDGEPPMPELQSLANDMPGWHLQYRDTVGGRVRAVLKPVTFSAFASILGEFVREYECKLTEFQDQAFEIVWRGQDMSGNPIPGDQSEYGYRLGVFHRLQLIERQRARTAVERTIEAFRSLEMNYVYAKQLTCFQRASLDMKNELGLLADAMSCMPRIWDAVTSLHDRK